MCSFDRTYTFSVREDLINDKAEILMIDICLPKTKPILLGVCYRPQQNSFYEHLENVLNKYPKWMERECILMGDCLTSARSILPKMDEIRFLLNKSQVGDLCISETWLDHSIN